MRRKITILPVIGVSIALFTGVGFFFNSCAGAGGGTSSEPMLYVGGYDTAKIYVIGPEAKDIIKTIDLPVNAKPDWLTLSPDGKKLYCSSDDPLANPVERHVYIIDTETNTYEKAVEVCTSPRGIAFTPDGSIAAVACSVDIALLDATDGTYADGPTGNAQNTIKGGLNVDNPNGIEVHPNESLNRLYFGSSSDIRSAPVQGGTVDRTEYNAPSGAFIDVEVSSDGNRLYSSGTDVSSDLVVTFSIDGSGSLSPIDTANRPGSSHTDNKIGLSPDGKHLYFANYSYSKVDYMDTSNTSLLTNLDTNIYDSIDITFSDDSSVAFILQKDPDMIVLINTADNSVAGTINLPEDCNARSLVYKP
jgi:YVTN family beta-propeller protein